MKQTPHSNKPLHQLLEITALDDVVNNPIRPEPSVSNGIMELFLPGNKMKLMSMALSGTPMDAYSKIIEVANNRGWRFYQAVTLSMLAYESLVSGKWVTSLLSDDTGVIAASIFISSDGDVHQMQFTNHLDDAHADKLTNIILADSKLDISKHVFDSIEKLSVLCKNKPHLLKLNGIANIVSSSYGNVDPKIASVYFNEQVDSNNAIAVVIGSDVGIVGQIIGNLIKGVIANDATADKFLKAISEAIIRHGQDIASGKTSGLYVADKIDGKAYYYVINRLSDTMREIAFLINPTPTVLEAFTGSMNCGG